MCSRKWAGSPRRSASIHIISHRGFWLEGAEKNTELAFERSFSLGFGTETDIRDFAGELIISHDIPQGGEPTLVTVLEMARKAGCTGPFALNIKADGLQMALAEVMASYPEMDYFVFDMSLPDTLGYARQGLPFYLRQSEYEQAIPKIEHCKGIWLDAFHSCWYDARQLGDLLKHYDVCLVSAELHHRPHKPFWEWLQTTGLSRHARLCMCTDYPLAAREFFHAKD